MKLATLKDGSRDGQLLVVSRDLTQAHFATGIATRLQQVLDDWNFISPQLEDLYATLNGGKARHAFAFEPQRCMAPLPRAYQWIEASAYPSHVQRLGAGSAGLAAAWAQRSSDDFLGPHQDARFASTDGGIDFAGGLAVITGDLPMGATPDEALDSIRLLMLTNAWCLRDPAGHRPMAQPAGKGGKPGNKANAGAEDGGPVTPSCQPATGFAPLAVTPEELGTRWRGGRAHGALSVHWNGRRVGHCDTGADMALHFGDWLALLAQSRTLRAGSILGAGAASMADAGAGCSCIAELRAVQAEGQPPTPYMQWGDTVRMEMLAENGQSLFGALEQRVVNAREPVQVAPEATSRVAAPNPVPAPATEEPGARADAPQASDAATQDLAPAESERAVDDNPAAHGQAVAAEHDAAIADAVRANNAPPKGKRAKPAARSAPAQAAGPTEQG